MTVTKAQAERTRIEDNRRTAFLKKVRSLIGHVSGRVGDLELFEAFAAGTTAEDTATAIAAREPVGLALHPAKAAAVQHAEDRARERALKVRLAMEAAGWDLEVAAPYPHHMSAWDKARPAARDKHNFYSSLTRTPEGVSSFRRKGDPDPREWSVEGVERFVNLARRDAAMQYDMFICKMVRKVGEVTTAVIDGNHVWSHSHLTVTLPDGTPQIWRTQQIVNYSSLGNAYYQWPSRVVKAITH